MKLTFLNCLLLFILFSCEKPDPIPPDPPDPIDSTFVLKWNTKLEYNHAYGSGSGFIFKNEFIVEAVDLDSISFSRIIGFDKYKGNKLWDFEITKERGGRRGIVNVVQKDNILIISTLTALFGFDLESRSVIWSKVHNDTGEDGWAYINILNNYVYTEVSTGSYASIGFKNKLARFNIFNGYREDIYEFIHPKGWSVGYSQPAMYVDLAQGDTILIFKRYYSSPTEGPKIPSDLVAYNLTKKLTMWEKVAFSPLSSSEFYPSNIVGDDVLVVSDNSVYKYDIMTGELLWQNTLGSNPNTLLGYFLISEPKVYNNCLYLQENGKAFYCIDVNSGFVKWVNNDASPSPGNSMVINNGMVINCSGGKGRIRGYDLDNGYLFMSQKSPNGNAIENGIVYDNETDTYFTKDFYSAFAFKVNKPK